MAITDKQESTPLRINGERVYSAFIRATPWDNPAGRGGKLRIIASPDNGVTWRHVASTGCSSTKGERGDGFPGLGVDLTPYRGMLVKTVVEVDSQRPNADVAVETR